MRSKAETEIGICRGVVAYFGEIPNVGPEQIERKLESPRPWSFFRCTAPSNARRLLTMDKSRSCTVMYDLADHSV